MRRFQDPAYGFIIIWLVVIFAPTFIATDTPNHLRTTALIPAIFILPALGAVWLWEAWESRLFVRQADASVMLRALATAVLVTEVARGFVEGEGMELTAPSRFA